MLGIILSLGGTKKILAMLSPNSAEKTLVTGVKLLKVLSVEDQNKIEIIDNGGVELLISMMNCGSDKVAMDALWTLRNVSDQINQR